MRVDRRLRRSFRIGHQGLAGWANRCVGDLLAHADRLEERIDEYDRALAEAARQDARSRRLMGLRGVGPTTASALLASLGAYLDTGYASGTLKFHSFNSETKDFEVVADIDNNALEVDKANILAQFDRDAAKKRHELEEIEQRSFFLAHFGRYFEHAQTFAA